MAKPCPLVPAPGHVIVERNEADEITPGGIIIPDKSREKPLHGKILAVGDGRLVEFSEGGAICREPMPFKVGQEVYFSNYAGREVEIEGRKFIIMRQEDLMAARIETA